MANRKQRQQQARAERERLEAEEAVAARRRRMTQLGTAAVFAALIVVGALIAISQSGSDSGDAEIEGGAAIERELKGLEQTGITLGDPNAPVTIAEFGDLQCPVCREFADQVIPGVIEEHVRPGDAKLEFKNFTILGPDSTDAAKAALAAGNQDRMWEFVDLFYRNQGTENSGYVTDDFLEAVARGAGIPDIEQWNVDREDPALDAEIGAVQSEATRIGFNATPSFLIEGPGGRRALTAPTPSELDAAVNAVS